MKYTYYHISKEQFGLKQLQVGERIEVGSRLNNYFSSLYRIPRQTTTLNNQQFHIVESIDKIILPRRLWGMSLDLSNEENISEVEAQLDYYEDLLMTSKWELFQYIKLYREIVFEEIRKEKYPEKPSRQKCVWLSEEKSIPFWKKVFDDNNSRYKILKVKVDGNIFKTDGKFITADTIGVEEMERNAMNYWSFDANDISDEPEVLFEGSLEVLEEFEK